MNTQALQAMCRDCFLEVPNLEFDEAEFEFQWELFEAKGLLGKPVSFGERVAGEPERGLFGLDSEPTINAIVIGVLSNVVYDVLKVTMLSDRGVAEFIPSADEILDRLGDFNERSRTIAIEVWKYARDNITRFIDELRD